MELSKVITNEQGLPEVIDVVPPEGWEEEHVNAEDNNDSIAERQKLASIINATLTEAAYRVEDLIDELAYRPGIEVPTAYLTITPDGGYHVFLLISQEDYHSTRIHAAHLVVEKYMADTTIAMRFTFTIGRQHIMSYMTTNTYKLKYTPHYDKSA